MIGARYALMEFQLTSRQNTLRKATREADVSPLRSPGQA